MNLNLTISKFKFTYWFYIFQKFFSNTNKIPFVQKIQLYKGKNKYFVVMLSISSSFSRFIIVWLQIIQINWLFFVFLVRNLFKETEHCSLKNLSVSFHGRTSRKGLFHFLMILHTTNSI